MSKGAPITELPIHTYRPTATDRACIAMIGSLPMIFRGPTVECARNNADAWRHEEVAKVKAAAAKRAETRAKKEGP